MNSLKSEKKYILGIIFLFLHCITTPLNAGQKINENRKELLKLRLNLSNKQLNKIKINQSRHKEKQKKFSDFEIKKRNELKKELEKSKSDEAKIKILIEELNAIREDIIDLKVESVKTLKSILTTEQHLEILKIKEEQKEKRKRNNQRNPNNKKEINP